MRLYESRLLNGTKHEIKPNGIEKYVEESNSLLSLVLPRIFLPLPVRFSPFRRTHCDVRIEKATVPGVPSIAYMYAFH